jgi:hypothetical protein
MRIDEPSPLFTVKVLTLPTGLSAADGRKADSER